MIILVFIFLILLVYIIFTYNRIIKKKVEVEKRWNEIYILINKQYDLLINTRNKDIKKYLNNLKDNDISNIINGYMHIVELMEKQNKDEFNDIDNKIQSLTREYNNSVLRYNNIINVIPNNMIAYVFNIHEGIYFRSNK